VQTMSPPCYAGPMTEATDELRILSRALKAHAKVLREAAEMAHERSAVLKELSRLLRNEAGAKREYAEAARNRHRDPLS
jgi:hypothetical protein